MFHGTLPSPRLEWICRLPARFPGSGIIPPPRLPARPGSGCVRNWSSLTVAGQRRISTGFPTAGSI